MGTTVYYFTGTGNSLFIAQQLGAAIEGAEVVPMLPLLHQEVRIVAPKRVGFVFPIYQSILPLVVKQAMARMDFSDSDYIFAIATRAGTTHQAFDMMDALLKPLGKSLSLSHSINMANNDPKFKYAVPTEADLRRIEKEALETVSALAEKIQNEVTFVEPDLNYRSKTPMPGLLAGIAKMTERQYDGFYSDDRCTGCGLCQKVCTSQKIALQDGRPVWNKETACYKCSACLNYCPMGAVQLRHFTEKNGRYTHPYAIAEVIEKQRTVIRD